MKRGSRIYLTTLLSCLATQAPALEIIFRYDLDNEGFFDQPGAKEALETAANFYEDLIVDELEAIDPGNFQSGTNFRWRPTYLEPNAGGAEQTVITETNLVVPENTIIIFAGGRNISTVGQGGPGGIQFLTPANSSWFNQLINRGEEGATTFQNNSFSSNPTDFAPWGGTVFFDSDRTWNFSTTDPSAVSGIDFLSVALHEIGHVLGIGHFGPTSSWVPLVSNSKFQGPLAKSSNSNSPPPLSGWAHWSGSVPASTTLAIFGRAHGESQKALMQGIIATTNANKFAVPTDLDIAALRDIGWELADSPTNFEVNLDFDPAAPGIGIPTITGTHYQVMRSSSPESLSPSGPEIIGDGTVQTWTDPEGPAARAFYSVEACPVPTGGSKSSQTKTAKSKDVPAPLDKNGLPSLPPVQCQCGTH